jgi:hypothetical protein
MPVAEGACAAAGGPARLIGCVESAETIVRERGGWILDESPKSLVP